MWDSPLSAHGYMHFQWGVVIAVSLVAAATDWHSRRIPNVLTVPVLVAGLAWALFVAGGAGLLEALAGVVLMGFPFVLLFVYAGGGAGDAKLMGALGAWLGVSQGLLALVAVLAAGVVFGLAMAAGKRQLRGTLSRLWEGIHSLFVMVSFRLVPKPGTGTPPPVQPGQVTMPYGIPICAGVCLAAARIFLWTA